MQMSDFLKIGDIFCVTMWVRNMHLQHHNFPRMNDNASIQNYYLKEISKLN